MGEDTKSGGGGSIGGHDRTSGDANEVGAAPAHTSATEWQLDAGDVPIMTLGVPAPVSEDEARLLAFVAQTTGQTLPPKRPANLPLIVGAAPGQVAPRTTIRDALIVNVPPPIRERNATAPPPIALPQDAPPGRKSPPSPEMGAGVIGLDLGPAPVAAPATVPSARRVARRSIAPLGSPLSPLFFGAAAALAAGFMLFLMLVTPGVERAESGSHGGTVPAAEAASPRVSATAANRR